MKTKTRALQIAFALASLAVLALLLPVLGMVLLGLLTLVLPLLLVLAPVLLFLPVAFLIDRARRHDAAGDANPVTVAAPAVHAPAR
jgi:hypothetical protein